MTQRPTLLTYDEYMSDMAPPMHEFSHQFLAEGDSWFSIGALNLLRSANLLFAFEFERSAVVVQCANPGDTLRRMSQTSRDPRFQRLLRGRLARRWSAILFSGGGNDLIDACQVGLQHPAAQRILLGPEEWGDAALGPARYLSEAGWATFSAYLKANLDALVALRERGPSAGRPIFMHTYAYPTPNDAGPGLGLKPWLRPALAAAQIPEADWPATAKLLIDRLAELLLACAADAARFPALHVFDSRQVAITPAACGVAGESGDWLNEIHLNHSGCRKLTAGWAAQIEGVLARSP
jgi:hypothetical protein